MVTFGQICNFCDSVVVTFYLCIYLSLNEEHFIFHPQYKHSGTFANRNYKERLAPKIKKSATQRASSLLKRDTTSHSHKGGGECDHATLHKCLGWTHLRGAISYQGISH